MDKIGFGTLNSIVLGVYLIAMLAIVCISLKKQVKARTNSSKPEGTFHLGQ